jgi:hypothetical protein
MRAPSPAPHEAPRAWAAALCCLLAALLLARRLVARSDAPVEGAVAQAQLDELARTLMPLAELLPAGEPLAYLRPTDSVGRPLFPETDFPGVLSVLAPRRVAHSLESRFLLVHHRKPDALRLVKGLEQARLVASLGPDFALFEREAP